MVKWIAGFDGTKMRKSVEWVIALKALIWHLYWPQVVVAVVVVEIFSIKHLMLIIKIFVVIILLTDEFAEEFELANY